MINIEIKVVASNLEEVKDKAIKIGAKNIATLSQIDTYFLVGEKRLKLREDSVEAIDMKKGTQSYKPMWVNLSDIKNINLFPEKVKEEIIKKYL